jgi:hypothetical protein
MGIYLEGYFTFFWLLSGALQYGQFQAFSLQSHPVKDPKEPFHR